MTLAVFSADPAVVEPCFVRMAELREQLRNNDRAAGSYEELSMGMSGDFELAIAHGATCVRIGEAIFGARLDPNAYWNPAGLPKFVQGERPSAWRPSQRRRIAAS